MDYGERERIVYRICSGLIRVRVRRRIIIIKPPKAYHKYLACEIYDRSLIDALNSGLYNDAQLLDFLIEQEIWTLAQQQQLDQIQNNLDDVKIKLYQAALRSQERETLRKVLNKMKSDAIELYTRRHSYDFLSASGYATSVKNQYLLACSLYNLNNRRIYKNYFRSTKSIINDVIPLYNKFQISELQFRELARNEPWRSIWNVRKTNNGIFSNLGCDLTEDQRNLVSWSLLYDNIYESPDCPSEDVINDDDMLDGWLLTQRQKRERSMSQKQAEELLKNPKIKNADEIFIMASSKEDIKKINSLNDASGQMTRRQKFKMIDQHGRINEMDMPDTKLKLQMEANKKFMKGPHGR